jgi:hypothetical protein
MTNHSFGIEFNQLGSALPEGELAGHTDIHYADLITRILEACTVEGDMLEGITPEERPVIDFRRELIDFSAFSPQSPAVALLPDHAVPPVLGMCRIALDRMRSQYINEGSAQDSYSDLPSGTLRALIHSLQDYEDQRSHSVSAL